MTDEEKKAIERLDKRLTIEKYTKNIGTPVYIDDLKIALNLIQKQQEELTRTKTDLQNTWHNNLELAEKCLKQDKIIDLILDKFIEGTEYYFSEFDYMNKEEIKQYFEKKVNDK